MADIKKNQSKVFNALKGMGFSGIGANEEEFAAKMGNARNREKVYKALSGKGYKGIGKDQAAFDSLIYEEPASAPDARLRATPEQEVKAAAVSVGNSAEMDGGETGHGFVPSWQDRVLLANAAPALGAGLLDKTVSNLDTYWRQRAMTGGVAKTDARWNPSTGKMEQGYITSAGTEHESEGEAREVQRRLEDAYWREAHPLEAAEREIGEDLRDIRSEDERLTERRKSAEGGKRPEDKTWWDYFKEGFGASAVSGIAPMGSNVDRAMVEAEMTRKGAYGAERQGLMREQDVLLARRRLAEEAQQLLADVRKDGQGYGFWSGLGRAGGKVLSTALDPHTWDFGEADLNTQLAVAGAVIKSDSGLGISSNEYKLLDSWAKNAAVSSQFGDQLSGWTKAGMVTGESLPFMVEMALNPASGLGEAATTQLVKYSLKKYGTKWVKDHAKSVLAKKIAARLVGDLVGAGVMASTTGAARVAADYERRMTGKVDIGVDADGDIIYNGVMQETKDNPGAALFKAMSSTAIENWSEMAGEYLGFVNSFFGKALGKTVVGKAGRRALAATGSVEGVSLNKAQKFIYDLAADQGIGAFSEGLKQFADRTQWHGVIGEYLEEELGNIANAAIVGDMTFDTAKNTGVFNLEQNIDTFCGVALMGGFVSALHTAGFAAHKWNYNVDMVSRANAQLFGDQLWNRIKTTIDSSLGDPRGLNDVLTDLVGGEDVVFDSDGKKAILKYAQASLERQGAEMTQYQPRMASSKVEHVPDGANPSAQWLVTSYDKNGDVIERRFFESEDEASGFEGELRMKQQQQDYKDYLSMTNKLSYPEASHVIDDFLSANGLDGSDASTIAAINDPKSGLGKRFQQFKTERILAKARANEDAIARFEEENGWSAGTVSWLSEQDPMQLDSEGLSMSDQARTFLEGLAYPPTEVHVEHEQQVGADVGRSVVEEVVSGEGEAGSMAQGGAQIIGEYNNARNAVNELFSKNEELSQEFHRLTGMGLSPQEVISSLDTFRPSDVQVIIDYFNAEALQESFLRSAAGEIDEAAANERKRRTLKGTIDGKADVSGVHTITNGTESFTLVSGDITTDPATGRITGSSSGLVIGLDDGGNFVTIRDAEGYSVLPVTETLDQWEEGERLRLQRSVTSAVDPEEVMNPGGGANTRLTRPGGAADAGQGGDAGGEAGATDGAGGNEPAAPAPSAGSGEDAAEVHGASIESVTDKDGIKRYEQGIAVDDAIADMIASGDDVNEIADASIAEAQEVVSKINGKQVKTRKDLAYRKKAQGVIDYYNDVKRRNQELHPVYADASPFVQQMDSAGSKKKADEILNSALQAGVNPQEIQPVHTQRVSELIARDESARKAADEITEKDYEAIGKYGDTPEGRAWLLDRKRVPSAEKRRKIARLLYGGLFDDDFEAIRDVYELVSSWLGKGRTLDPDSFGRELGWDMGVGKDASKVSTMFSARRENGGDGMLFNDFVHLVAENSGGRFDTEEVRNAVIEMFQRAQEKSELTEYQLLSRIWEAESALQEEETQDEEAGAAVQTEAEVAPLADGGLPFGPAPEGERPAFLGEEEEASGAPVRSTAEREAVAAVEPSADAVGTAAGALTVDEIEGSSFPKQVKTLAKAYLDGNHGDLQTAAYRDIYEEVRGEEPANEPAVEPQGATGGNAPASETEGAANAVKEIVEIADRGKKQKPVTTNDPMEAINEAAGEGGASTRLTEQERGGNSAEVNGETAEQKRARLKQEILEKARRLAEMQKQNLHDDLGKLGANRLTPSFIPRDKEQRKLFWDLVSSTAEYGYTYIQEGVRDFKEWSRRVYDDVVSTMQEIFGWSQDDVDGYTDAVWNSEVEVGGETKTLAEWAGEKPNNAKNGEQTVNEHNNVLPSEGNIVSSQQESVSDEQRAARKEFVLRVSNALHSALKTNTGKPYKNIIDLRKTAQLCGMEVDMDGRDDILLQELVENALVAAARRIIQPEWGDELRRGEFDQICRLYEMQPTISQRSSNRIRMQQYSTPLPMACVADMMVEGAKRVLEPTAGNGMLVIGLPVKSVHVNELDQTRLENLRGQGFKSVTNQDATQPFEGDEQYDAVIANPPFGSAPAKEYDGKAISGLEEQIALNALEKMKDDGRAAIIIGGSTEYAGNGSIKNNKAFMTYLYDHYNVKGVIDMDGKLYQKQGTTYPTRMILIDGRRSEEERAQAKVFPPTKDKAPRKATTFDELYDIAEEIRTNNNKTNGTEQPREGFGLLFSPGQTADPVVRNPSGKVNERGRDTQPNDGNRKVERVRGGLDSGPESELVPGAGNDKVNRARREAGGQGRNPLLGRVSDGQSGDRRSGRPSSPERSGSGAGASTNERGADGGADVGRSRPVDSGLDSKRGSADRKPLLLNEEKREIGSDKLPYRPHNTALSLESVAPAAMVEAMDDMLSKIEKEHGDIDEWVTRELGYENVTEMHGALAAEQVDSVAMAIYQMQHGQGMIIGDQTGVGKGRQMAALIRWACRQEKKPIFVTKDDTLFSDIYRDLVDIGSGELRPFIFNADVSITDAKGNVVHKSLSPSAQKRVLEMSELPDGFDFAILSYHQMNTGDKISQEESQKNAKDKGKRGKKSATVKKGEATPKADFLRRIAKDNYLLMDESQNAAGSGNTGSYFQSILKDAKAVTFASATFAKRPDAMPLYALRTAMSKAKVKAEELIKIIKNGGVTLQEIMSRAMTLAGQMVRRERDMSDVKTDWKVIDDKETAERARRNYDNAMRAFNAIISFQENYVKPRLSEMSSEMAVMAASVGERRGTSKAGIDNPPFVNKLFNFSKQLLLSLKVDAVVNEVVKEIESGRHPVIALENTLESALEDYNIGEVIDEPTLFGKLKKGLDATLRYTVKDEDGKESGGELSPSQLGSEGESAYNELVETIREATEGMFISPLDAITEKLEAKGYRVGEISGRDKVARLNDNGEFQVEKRQNTETKKLARDFNNGDIDVLIVNKKGSTGISLHASTRKDVADKRQRVMIMAQPLSDINDYMQMIGRIDRTGQVHRGYYINLGLPVPAETRFMMMLSNKLKSLNANTTTSQSNKDNDVDAPDLLNKYGDQVMIEYLRDNPEVYRKLGEFLKDSSGAGSNQVTVARLDEYKPKEGDAKQITGRVALLPVDEQDAFYNDVTRRYNELIKYLDDTGSNDLKISVLPLRARTIERQVSSEGSDPNGQNPFAQDAYVEWVEMDVLKKPMKAAEVGKVIEQLNPEVSSENAPEVHANTRAQEKMLAQRMTPRVREIFQTVEQEYNAKMAKEDARYEEAKAKAEESIKEQTEKINASKRTPEQKQEAIEKYRGDRLQAVEETHTNMVNKIDASRERIEKPLRDFEVGEPYLVPDDLTTDTFLGASPAIFCGFKAKDEGVTPSTTLAVFCTLDGRRKIEVKLSDWNALSRIKNHTEQNWDAAHEVTLSNWDSQIPNESRTQGFIMTGNILQAFSDAGLDGHVPGQLVTYTDMDGNVHDGILMNKHWEPSQLKGSTVPIKNMENEIAHMSTSDDAMKSADGNVVIERYYDHFTISVPKSKKTGGQYYGDGRLLSLVDGRNFYPHRGMLVGDVPLGNIREAIGVLNDLGVQMKSDRQVRFDTETEMGQARASGRRLHVYNDADPMEAIAHFADEWLSEKEGHEGNKDGKSALPKKRDNHERHRHTSKKGGRGGLRESDTSHALPRRTRTLLERIGRQLGVTIEVEARESGSDSGGRWDPDTRTITLSVDTATDTHKAIMQVFGHELTHAIKSMNSDYPQVWDAFVAVIKERIGDEEFNRLLERYRENYDKAHDARGMERLDDAGVVEEICADVAGRGFFTDKGFVKSLIDHVEREGGDLQSFIDRMLDFISDIIDRIKAALDFEGSETVKNDVTLDMAREIWSDMYQYAAEKEIAEQGQSKLHVIQDPSLIDRLERGPKIKTYRAMKLIGGRLYPPMATRDAKTKALGSGIELGKWEEAEEHPEKAFSKKNANGDDVWYFSLQKTEKSGDNVTARYNPYIHSSTTMLNDQFRSAETHPDLVVVEMEVPESELTSGYKAERAKDGVGMLRWTAGTIQKQLTGMRQVMLSRWAKPVRIVPVDEYAKHVAELVRGQVEVFPSGIVTPEQRKALEAEGIKFVQTNGQLVIQEGEHKGENYEQVYARKGEKPKSRNRGIRLSVEVDADPIAAINRAAEEWRREREDRAGDIRAVDEYSAKRVYHERIDRVGTMFAEAWQDDMVTFKAGQYAIARDEDIPDSQNAYQAMNLSYGKTFTEQEQFTDLYKKPLLMTVNKVMKRMGWRTGDVDRYLFTKHGLERNRELFVRDWLERQRKTLPHSYEDLSPEERSMYDGMAATIEQMFEDGDIASEEEKEKKLSEALVKAHQRHIDEVERKFVEAKQDAYVRLMDGKITFAAYLDAVDDFITEHIDGGFDAEEHDYSGFTEMFGDEDGHFDESEIVSDLMDDEEAMSDALQKELWSRVNDCSQYGLEKYRTSGMTSDETSKRISDMFHWYVPMRGFNEGMAAQDHWQYMTVKDGAGRIGGLLKKAKGRRSEAGFPLATLFGMTYKAISDANQNEVKKYFWRLVQAHPSDLVVTSESWAELEPSTGEWVVSYPPVESDMTGPMVAAKVKDWQERMRKAERDGTARKLRGKARFDYKVDKGRQREHIVEVMLNGERKMMIVTGNPRMAQAINGQLRYEGSKGAVSRALSAMKHFMQSVSTSFNLTFVGRNMSRDWTHFGVVLSVREGMGYEGAAQKYYWRQLPKMVSLFKKYRGGTLDMRNEMERDFKDFMDNGGITGFVHMQKVEGIQREMQKFMEEQKSGKMIRLNDNVWTKMLHAVEAMNEAVENNARFATYRASRHYAGRTKARSAYDAKEVTANFNKKGAGRKTSGFKTDRTSVAAAAKLFGETGQILSANKMFFNATIQAICTIFKNTRNKDGSLNWPYISKLALGYAQPPFLLGFALPLINSMLVSLAGGGDGDDPYANLPEWTRRKAICLYMGWIPGCGKQDFLILPIGQELAAFYSLGDMLAGKTYARELDPLDKDFADEMLGFFNVFSPVDFDTKITSDDNSAPISEYVGRVYSVAAPLVAIGENMSWNGRPIFREDKYPNDKFVPEYKMSYNNTNPQFVAISKWLNDVTGGDDVSRGVLQINPATMQYLVEQYTGGPGKLFANTLVSAGNDLKNAITGGEVDFNIRKVEGVRAFWQQGDDRTRFNRTQAKYRKYKEEADELAYKLRSYQKDAGTNPDHYMKQEELGRGVEPARYLIIHEADKVLRELSTRVNESTGLERKNLLSLYNDKLKRVVDSLDNVGQIPPDDGSSGARVRAAPDR